MRIHYLPMDYTHHSPPCVVETTPCGMVGLTGDTILPDVAGIGPDLHETAAQPGFPPKVIVLDTSVGGLAGAVAEAQKRAPFEIVRATRKTIGRQVTHDAGRVTCRRCKEHVERMRTPPERG